MMQCSPSMETVCADGRACLDVLGASSGVCYLGGNVPIGSTCAQAADCTRSGICASYGSPVRMTCVEGCNLDGTHPCVDGSACLPGGGFGFCTPPVH